MWRFVLMMARGLLRGNVSFPKSYLESPRRSTKNQIMCERERHSVFVQMAASASRLSAARSPVRSQRLRKSSFNWGDALPGCRKLCGREVA